MLLLPEEKNNMMFKAAFACVLIHVLVVLCGPPMSTTYAMEQTSKGLPKAPVEWTNVTTSNHTAQDASRSVIAVAIQEIIRYCNKAIMIINQLTSNHKQFSTF